MKTVQFSQKFKRQVNKNINFLIKVIVGAFFSSKPRVSLVAFWLFLLSHIEELITDGTPLSSAHAYKAEGGGRVLRITDGTPLSSAHAYEAEGGGRFLQCETAKKAKRLQGTPLTWS